MLFGLVVPRAGLLRMGGRTLHGSGYYVQVYVWLSARLAVLCVHVAVILTECCPPIRLRPSPVIVIPRIKMKLPSSLAGLVGFLSLGKMLLADLVSVLD